MTFGQTTIIEWNFFSAAYNAGISGNTDVNISTGGALYSGVGCGYQEAISNNIDANDAWISGSFKTTGYSSCKYSFNQNRFNNGPTAFKFQYRLSSSGSWVDIVGPYSTSATGCTGYNPTNVSLPSACDNQAR